MSEAAQKVDPGLGDAQAPRGTEERAKFVRLKLTVLVTELPKTPANFAAWWGELIATYPDPKGGNKPIRGWQLVGDDIGKPFKSLAAFCEFRRPWGLGKPQHEIVAYLRAAHVLPKPELGGVKVETDPGRVLARVGAVDGRASNGAAQPRDEKGRVLPKSATSPDSTDDRENRRIRSAEDARAINRAPAPVGIAWDAGLVSTAVAVKASGAGPDVGEAVEGVIRERGAPATTAEKVATKKAVDAAVKEKLAPETAKPPIATYSSAAARDTAKVALHNVKHALASLRGADRETFGRELTTMLNEHGLARFEGDAGGAP